MYKLFSWVKILLFFIFKKIIFISCKTCNVLMILTNLQNICGLLINITLKLIINILYAIYTYINQFYYNMLESLLRLILK